MKKWLLVLLVVKRNNFLLEATVFMVTRWLLLGYSLVTPWLLVYTQLQLFDTAFLETSN